MSGCACGQIPGGQRLAGEPSGIMYLYHKCLVLLCITSTPNALCGRSYPYSITACLPFFLNPEGYTDNQAPFNTEFPLTRRHCPCLDAKGSCHLGSRQGLGVSDTISVKSWQRNAAIVVHHGIGHKHVPDCSSLWCTKAKCLSWEADRLGCHFEIDAGSSTQSRSRSSLLQAEEYTVNAHH